MKHYDPSQRALGCALLYGAAVMGALCVGMAFWWLVMR